MKTKTIRELRLLLNEIYLTYGMTHKLSDALMDKIAHEIDNAEPHITAHPVLGNDIQLKPEQEANRDVHTEHCCIIHGCRYSPYDKCSVTKKIKGQSYFCEDCGE